MPEAAKTAALSFEKIVYDSLLSGFQHEGSRDSSDKLLKLSTAKKEVGLHPFDVARAVASIRQKGYPVVSATSKRMSEDGFSIPKTHSDYMAWRDVMVHDIRALVDLLKLMDAGSEARFNIRAPKQEWIF